MDLSQHPSPPLAAILRGFNEHTPRAWLETGVAARKDLHGLIRYPAMMVPQMQADILDAILRSTGTRTHVIDPFVGSGTVMTEAMRRGLPFTGVDINPLAILTCQAKVSIEAGVALDSAVVEVIECLKRDHRSDIDVEFHKQTKWFTVEQSIVLSRLRRAIMSIDALEKRQCLWVALAETIRSCSKSRTSTYKLHKRAEGDVVEPEKVSEIFESNLYDMLDRVRAYRAQRGVRESFDPLPELICGEVQHAHVVRRKPRTIVMTSPPYGDNRTTIPYGQFSYLALNWIPVEDMPQIPVKEWLENAAAIDTASLGGSLRDADDKCSAALDLSASYRSFSVQAAHAGKAGAVRKVGAFIFDFHSALAAVRASIDGPSHWVVTSGNRRVANSLLPFDRICEEIVEGLGGQRLEVIHRRLPVKRMPNRNSQGALMTSETTLVAQFA